MATNAERQAAYRARMLDSGEVRINAYVRPEAKAALEYFAVRKSISQDLALELILLSAMEMDGFAADVIKDGCPGSHGESALYSMGAFGAWFRMTSRLRDLETTRGMKVLAGLAGL